MSHLTAEHLDRFYGALVKAGYSRSTVRGCHILVCRVLDQAQRWGWVAVNVGRDARPPRQTGSNPKPVPVDVMLTMLDAADGTNPTLAMLIVLAADTGARRGELCALRWRHVDFDERTLRIEAAIGETNVVYEKDTKNHPHRTVSLSEFAVDWLNEHWTRHAKACALCGTELSDDAYVLAPEPGGLTPWHPSNASRAFSRLRDRMELPTWVHLHGLRHLQVTHLLDAGIPLRSVSGRVGHLNMSTTGNIYAHWIQESDSRSAQVHSPWFTPDDDDARRLEREALAEIGPGHVLEGVDLTTVARCNGCDDTVFRCGDGTLPSSISRTPVLTAPRGLPRLASEVRRPRAGHGSARTLNSRRVRFGVPTQTTTG